MLTQKTCLEVLGRSDDVSLYFNIPYLFTDSCVIVCPAPRNRSQSVSRTSTACGVSQYSQSRWTWDEAIGSPFDLMIGLSRLPDSTCHVCPRRSSKRPKIIPLGLSISCDVFRP